MRHLIPIVGAAIVLASVPAVAQQVSATAPMMTADGADAGTVTFNQTKSGILHIIVEMTGMPPGTHGFHVHETGDCNPAGGFQSAGGHYAGDGKSHGIIREDGPHAGDLPNVHVGPDGILKVEIFSERMSLGEGGRNPLMDEDGSAVIVHSGPDDYTSQPSGDAGDRIACGVIEQPS